MDQDSGRGRELFASVGALSPRLARTTALYSTIKRRANRRHRIFRRLQRAWLRRAIAAARSTPGSPASDPHLWRLLVRALAGLLPGDRAAVRHRRRRPGGAAALRRR